jgi:hypothetical protein
MAFSSILGENRRGMELCMTIGTLPSVLTLPSPVWTWTFDVGLGLLILFYEELKGTHLMFCH